MTCFSLYSLEKYSLFYDVAFRKRDINVTPPSEIITSIDWLPHWGRYNIA
jgi:hypothetical protein